MKYYAVKKGRSTGIYTTWEECQQQIHGYSGAVFKSFTTEEAASLYLQEEEGKKEIDNSLPYAYIDGSFSSKNGCYGWGGFVEANKRRWIIQGKGNTPKYLPERNIAGELIGTLQVLFLCEKYDITEINVFYDYSGIENYVNGSWKPQTPLAKYYADTIDFWDGNIKLNFHSVKGHTGVMRNELADLLAKEAVGADIRKKDIPILNEFKEGGEVWK